MQNQTQNLNQNSEQNQEQPPKKDFFSFISVKTLSAVLIFTALAVIIIGGWVYIIGDCSNDKTDNPIIPVVSEIQCKIDSDCKLISAGGCPCSTSDEEFKCFPREEAIKRRQKEMNNPERLLCSKCPQPLEIQHTCKCANGKCEKVKIEEVEKVVIATDKMEYGQRENVNIIIKNNFFEEIFISYPIVEKKVNDNYISLRGSIVWPGCGVTGGLLYLPLEPFISQTYQWNQKEKWCSVDFLDRNVYSEEILHGKYRIRSEIIKRVKNKKDDPTNVSGKPSGEFIYSNEFTIKKKLAFDSAFDPMCSEIVKIIGNCDAEVQGYHFDLDTEECAAVNGSGCSVETPFETLEECQEVCEKKNMSCEQAIDCIKKCPKCADKPQLSTNCTPRFRCVNGTCECECICLSM